MRINKYEDLGCKEDLRQLLHLRMEMKKHFILQNEIQQLRGKAVVAQEFDQKLRIAERLLDKVKALRNHIRQNGPSMPMDIDLSQTRRTNETTSSPKESSSGNFTKTPQSSSDTGEASFNVYLTEMGDKIETIKAIREFLNCGLKEAKDFADSNLPVCILENADGTRSNDFKMKLEAIGAGVNICAVGSAEDRMIHKGIYMPSASSTDKQEDAFEFGSAGSISLKKQQLKNSKMAFWFLVCLSFPSSITAVALGTDDMFCGVFLGIITLALVYMAYWLHNHIRKLESEIEIMEHEQLDSANPPEKQTPQKNTNSTTSQGTPNMKSNISMRLLIDVVCGFLILLSLNFDWGKTGILATAILSIMEGMANRHRLDILVLYLIVIFILLFYTFPNGIIMGTILLYVAFGIITGFVANKLL